MFTEGQRGVRCSIWAVPSAPRRTSLLAIFNNTETARDGFHITVVLAVDASDGEQQMMRLWRRARSRWRP